MEHWTDTVLLGAALLGTTAYLVYAYREAIKDLPVFKIKKAWRRLQSFEQHLLKAGFVLFLPIPFLKNHVLADSHLFEFFLELFPALASAMLITGIMALIREIHLETSSRVVSLKVSAKSETPENIH